jgi:predicted AlkP superfamily pyrophosphatase or phosphodiesterase
LLTFTGATGQALGLGLSKPGSQELDLDVAGHKFGFHPDVPQYANSVTTTDKYVSDLFSIIQTKRLNGEDWMIFIVSDHGGEGTGHANGFDNENIKYTLFYANHPYVSFRHSYKSTAVDLAPTIFAFMGINSRAFDCKTDGVSLIN